MHSKRWQENIGREILLFACKTLKAFSKREKSLGGCTHWGLLHQVY